MKRFSFAAVALSCAVAVAGGCSSGSSSLPVDSAILGQSQGSQASLRKVQPAQPASAGSRKMHVASITYGPMNPDADSGSGLKPTFVQQGTDPLEVAQGATV